MSQTTPPRKLPAAATNALFGLAVFCAGLLLAGCGGKTETTDRDKFVGTWDGQYTCPKMSPIADQLVIEKDSESAFGFRITIHATFENPDTVEGKLTGKNKITIPEQSMGGGPGTAKIRFEDDGTLSYTQKGGGITCTGEGYAKVPAAATANPAE